MSNKNAASAVVFFPVERACVKFIVFFQNSDQIIRTAYLFARVIILAECSSVRLMIRTADIFVEINRMLPQLVGLTFKSSLRV